MKAGLALMMGMFATLPGDGPAKIPSHKIEARTEEQQLSKRRIQKMKGQKARKNRGSNR